MTSRPQEDAVRNMGKALVKVAAKCPHPTTYTRNGVALTRQCQTTGCDGVMWPVNGYANLNQCRRCGVFAPRESAILAVEAYRNNWAQVRGCCPETS